MNTAHDQHRNFFYLLSIPIIIICAYLQISHFLNIPEPYQEPDSLEFLSPESVPYAWGSVKPPFVPLVYKLLGRNIELIAVVQLAFSLFSWSFLAYVVARSLKRALLIPIAFIMILGLSLSDAVSMWNKSILSESFSLSLLAFFTGIWFMILENITLKRVTMLILIATMFAMTRTANGFTLMMLALIVIVAILINRRSIQRRYYVLISTAFIILFLISNAISNIDNRWAPYFLNVVSMRILIDQEMIAYFEDNGMPVNSNLMSRSGKWSQDDDFAYYKDPGLEQFRNWVYSKGKSTYARYLLTHPAYLISAPLQDLKRMILSTESRLMYYAPKGFTGPLNGALFKYMSAWSMFIIYVFLAGVLFGLNLTLALSEKQKVIWVPLILIVLVYPLAVLTWHADAMEIERHALPISIQARLGFILMLLYGIDYFLLARFTSGKEYFKQLIGRNSVH